MIEVFPDYIKQYGIDKWYDTIYVINVIDFRCNYGQYDLVIMGDILEHLTVEDAQKVVAYFTEKNLPLLVLVPYNYVQGICFDNIHETHEQPDLTEALFNTRYPNFRKIVGNALQGVFFKDKTTL